MMVVGGRGTRWGPILGAAVLMLVDSGLREIPEFRNFGLALIIILSMIFLPGGLVKLVHGIFHWQPRSLIKLERTDQQLRQFQNQKTSKTKVY